jgi:hypothetical protein
MAPGLETSDLVKATAERYLERGFVEPTGSIIAAREDRERSHEQRHVASSMGRETYHDGRIIGRFRADEVAQQLLGDRMSLFLEGFQREGDVTGGERAAIVKRDAGPHQETISEPVGRYLHRTRSEAVQRVGLILGARRQALGRARISMMAWSDLLHARAEYRSARPVTATPQIQLATHGRSIQVGSFASIWRWPPLRAGESTRSDRQYGLVGTGKRCEGGAAMPEWQRRIAHFCRALAPYSSRL